MTTPAISNVSGTVSTGQTLTITGTNMVNHDTTDWVITEAKGSFEGATFAADDWDVSIATLDSSIKLMGSKSAHNFRSGAASGPDQNQGRLYNYGIGGTAPFYVRGYYRADSTTNGDGTWADNYHKIITHYDTPGSNTIYLDWLGNSGARPVRFNVVDSGNNPSDVVPLQEQKWHCIEIFFATACKVWFDNVLCFDGTMDGTPTAGAGNIELDTNQADTGAGWGFDNWWDGVAISTSRVGMASKVEIGNSATYATATKVYQFPETISETSNVVTCDLTGLGGGPYYLYVTNNLGETSSAYTLGDAPAGVAARAGTACLR